MKLHRMTEIPAGQAVADLHPAWRDVDTEVSIGAWNTSCPGCRKPFTPVRKARKVIRIFPLAMSIPIVMALRLCGTCVAKQRAGGDDGDAVLASIDAFVSGEAATQ